MLSIFKFLYKYKLYAKHILLDILPCSFDIHLHFFRLS